MRHFGLDYTSCPLLQLAMPSQWLESAPSFMGVSFLAIRREAGIGRMGRLGRIGKAMPSRELIPVRTHHRVGYYVSIVVRLTVQIFRNLEKYVRISSFLRL